MTDGQIANLIAILALIATIVGLALNWKSNVSPSAPAAGVESERLAKLQRERLEWEEADRNSIKLAVYWHNAGNCKGINVKNVGQRNAYNVNFEFLVDSTIVDSLIVGTLSDTFPVKCILPGFEETFLIAPTFDTGTSWRYRVSWTDERDETGSYEAVLSIL